MSKKAIHGHTTHGAYTLKRAVKELGSRAIDGRSKVAKALDAWRAELIADLGGDVSTQQKALIELAVRSKLLLDSLDAWLLEQPSLVNSRKRSVIPALIQRTQLSDSLSRYLTQLGLQRKLKPVSNLAALLNGSTTLPEPGGKQDAIHSQ